jgi:hypothetical protein
MTHRPHYVIYLDQFTQAAEEGSGYTATIDPEIVDAIREIAKTDFPLTVISSRIPSVRILNAVIAAEGEELVRWREGSGVLTEIVGLSDMETGTTISICDGTSAPHTRAVHGNVPEDSIRYAVVYQDPDAWFAVVIPRDKEELIDRWQHSARTTAYVVDPERPVGAIGGRVDWHEVAPGEVASRINEHLRNMLDLQAEGRILSH